MRPGGRAVRFATITWAEGAHGPTASSATIAMQSCTRQRTAQQPPWRSASTTAGLTLLDVQSKQLSMTMNILHHQH